LRFDPRDIELWLASCKTQMRRLELNNNDAATSGRRRAIVTITTTKTMFTPLVTPFGCVRQPTAEECELVGRDIRYSEPYEHRCDDWRDLGDYVIANDAEPEALAAILDACLELGMGDDAHIISAGIYVEE
jgi:hypothetical protein